MINSYEYMSYKDTEMRDVAKQLIKLKLNSFFQFIELSIFESEPTYTY